MTSPAVALPRVSEKQEQQAIIDLLKSVGAQVYKLGGSRRRGDFPGTMQTPGLPDIYAFLPAVATVNDGITYRDGKMPCALWIEVKGKGGRLRREQEVFRFWCQASAMIHIVGGVDVVIEWLKEHGWLK